MNQRLLDQHGQLKPLLVNVGYHSAVVLLQGYLVRNARSVLDLLWAAAFAPLIAAVNVTNLVPVRGARTDARAGDARGAGRRTRTHAASCSPRRRSSPCWGARSA